MNVKLLLYRGSPAFNYQVKKDEGKVSEEADVGFCCGIWDFYYSSLDTLLFNPLNLYCFNSAYNFMISGFTL